MAAVHAAVGGRRRADNVARITSRPCRDVCSLRPLPSTPVLCLPQPAVQLFGLEGRYAHALFSAASKSKTLAAVEKEVAVIKAKMGSDTVFAEFLASYGNFDIIFNFELHHRSTLRHPTRSAWHAPVGDHACWKLIGACHPML